VASWVTNPHRSPAALSRLRDLSESVGHLIDPCPPVVGPSLDQLLVPPRSSRPADAVPRSTQRRNGIRAQPILTSSVQVRRAFYECLCRSEKWTQHVRESAWSKCVALIPWATKYPIGRRNSLVAASRSAFGQREWIAKEETTRTMHTALAAIVTALSTALVVYDGHRRRAQCCGCRHTND
jgi:hypothetical protein